MKNSLLISFFLSLFANYGFAQCGANEVEVKVNITTDPYGSETYWTVKNLMGAVVMQGGQGGVYLGNTNYSDSICLLSNSCYFFDIYDTIVVQIKLRVSVVRAFGTGMMHKSHDLPSTMR